MKTFNFFFVMFCISLCSNSQATLEYTTYTYGPQDKSYFFNTENTSYHYIVAYDKTNFTIYTEDNSFYKLVFFPSGLFKDTIIFTDKLFNSDSLIEFIYVSYDNGPAQINDDKRMRLMNENGEILQDFGICDYAGIVKNINGEYKFITLLTGIKKVYSLSGTLSEDQQSILNKNLVAFPNPTDNVINMSNPLKSDEKTVCKVFSLDGKEVKSFDVNGTSEFIEIDVTDLAIGTYLFKIKNNTIKFVKK